MTPWLLVTVKEGMICELIPVRDVNHARSVVESENLKEVRDADARLFHIDDVGTVSTYRARLV